MRFLSGFADIITENEPLAPYTSLGVGGPARWMARPRTPAELAELVRCCTRAEVPVRLLGGGANLLVADEGVDGVVIRLNSSAFKHAAWPEVRAEGPIETEGTTEPGGAEVRVRVGAGADMNRLALDAVRRGLSGLECMGGIPGTLGGIIRMNAGGAFGQIADVVRSVTVIEPTGRQCELTPDEVGFGYRRTNLGDRIVCSAELGLRRGDPAMIRERFLEIWSRKKQTQPLAEPTAGCMFKNPPGASAGELIDRAGLKEHRVGGAHVSGRHANFIVADEGATARDVFTLIAAVRREVAQRFGVELELEVQVWGRHFATAPFLGENA